MTRQPRPAPAPLPTPSGGRRAFAAAALFVALVAQLGVTAHMGLVRHEVCAEHGDLVERDGAPSTTAPWAPAAPLSSPEHRHDHCPLTSPPGLVAAAGVAVVDAAPPVTLAILPTTTQAPPTTKLTSLALLSLAPKTSPPT